MPWQLQSFPCNTLSSIFILSFLAICSIVSVRMLSLSSRRGCRRFSTPSMSATLWIKPLSFSILRVSLLYMKQITKVYCAMTRLVVLSMLMVDRRWSRCSASLRGHERSGLSTP